MVEDEDGVRTSGSSKRGWLDPMFVTLLLIGTCGVIAVCWITGKYFMAGIGVVIVLVFIWSLRAGANREE